MRLPKYVHHKGSDRGTIQFKPLFGPSPHYLPGAYNSEQSRQAYREKLVEIAQYHAARKPRSLPSSNALVSQLCIEFLDWAAKHYGERSSEFAKYLAVVKLLRPYAQYRCEEFGPLRLQEVQRDMVGQGWYRATVNASIRKVVAMFKWGTSREMFSGLVAVNLATVAPLKKGKSAAPESRKVKPVSASIVRQVFPFLSPCVRAMVKVQYLTGMRPAEVCGLRMSELERTGEVWFYRPAKHKTAHLAKEKVICIGPKAQKILTPYLVDDGYFFRPRLALDQLAGKAPKKKRPLRDRYNSHSYFNAIKNGFRRLAASKGYEPAKKRMKMNRTHAAKAGIDWWHPHQLRHSRATITSERYGIEAAQALLGNTLGATQIYAERSLRRAAQIAKRRG